MITVPPQLREGTPEKREIEHIARQCMYRMNQARGNLTSITQRFTLDNGVEIICSYCYGKQDIWINLPPVVKGTTEIATVELLTGIICHPRSGTVQQLPYYEYVSDQFGTHVETKNASGVSGGWAKGKTLLTTGYLYPLVDADNASFTVSKPDKELVGEFADVTGNYGNIYWWDGDDEEPVFLSWRGTPTRHFRLASTIEIPGLSLFETSIKRNPEDTPQYTTFGTALYYGGNRMVSTPKWSWPYNNSVVKGLCLLLGACQNENGALYIVTHADHYNAPENVFIFSNGHRAEGATTAKTQYLSDHPDVTVTFEREVTKPGIFLTLWKQGGPVDGWAFVSEHSYSRNGVPWFANASGTEFVCSNGDKLTTAGVLTVRANTVGTWKETMLDPVYTTYVGQMRFNAAFSGASYHEYDLDTPVNSVVSVAATMQSDYSYTADTYKKYFGDFDFYISEEPDPLTLHSSTFGYYTEGGESPIVWTQSPGTCGTVWLIATDACGDQVSVEVRLESGYWELTSQVCWNDVCIADNTVSVIDGGTKTTYGVSAQCYVTEWDPARTDLITYCPLPADGGYVSHLQLPPADLIPMEGDPCEALAYPSGGGYCSGASPAMAYGTKRYVCNVIQTYRWVCP